MVWAERMASLTDTEFKQRYRLSKPLFTDLAGRLASRMQSKRRMVGIYAPIPVELQLSMTLRYLAGGSVYDTWFPARRRWILVSALRECGEGLLI